MKQRSDKSKDGLIGADAIGVIPGDYATRRVGDVSFGVRLTDRRDAGDLANGARGYTASVEIYRDGARIGDGRWDVDGFEDCKGLDGRPLDLGDGEGVAWRTLADLVRESLGCRDVSAASEHLAEPSDSELGPKPKPDRVEPGQPWRVAGEAQDLEVEGVDGDEAILRVRSMSTGEWVTWGRAPANNMLASPSWTFLGAAPNEEGGIVLAL